MGSLWSATKQTITEFFADDAMTLGAALAFYTALSLAPIIVILITIAGLALSPDQQQQVVQQIQSTVGARAGEAISTIVESAQQNKNGGTIAAIISGITLLLGATAVFAQLQYSMNRIWGVQAKSGGAWAWVRKRLLSLAMMATIAFLLLVSMVLSTALSMMFSGEGIVWQAVNFVVSMLVYILLFAVIFKVLPDVKIGWRMTWIGATVTAVLFALGKLGISIYLSAGAVGSAYGAAGSLIALLVWVYYSSLIVFVGAELTQVIASREGLAIEPDEHARPVPGVENHKPVAHHTQGREPRGRVPHPAH